MSKAFPVPPSKGGRLFDGPSGEPRGGQRDEGEPRSVKRLLCKLGNRMDDEWVKTW